MSSQRRISRRDLLSACSEIGPDDGHDPRFDRLGSAPDRVLNRKALQLCKQVAHTLAEFLPTLRDDLLRELIVTSVCPAPNSSRMLVTVSLPPGRAEQDRSYTEAVSARLQEVRGLFRTEVANAIHRRRTPELLFRVETPGL
jgi:ribosome-binding factor A